MHLITRVVSPGAVGGRTNELGKGSERTNRIAGRGTLENLEWSVHSECYGLLNYTPLCQRFEESTEDRLALNSLRVATIGLQLNNNYIQITYTNNVTDNRAAMTTTVRLKLYHQIGPTKLQRGAEPHAWKLFCFDPIKWRQYPTDVFLKHQSASHCWEYPGTVSRTEDTGGRYCGLAHPTSGGTHTHHHDMHIHTSAYSFNVFHYICPRCDSQRQCSYLTLNYMYIVFVFYLSIYNIYIYIHTCRNSTCNTSVCLSVCL